MQELLVDGCNGSLITDRSVIELVSRCRWLTLLSLGLSHGGISDRGLLAIADLPHLDAFSLGRNTAITAAGFSLFAERCQCRDLQDLCLIGSPLQENNPALAILLRRCLRLANILGGFGEQAGFRFSKGFLNHLRNDRIWDPPPQPHHREMPPLQIGVANPEQHPLLTNPAGSVAAVSAAAAASSTATTPTQSPPSISSTTVGVASASASPTPSSTTPTQSASAATTTLPSSTILARTSSRLVQTAAQLSDRRRTPTPSPYTFSKLKPRQIKRLLEKRGYDVESQRGSHQNVGSADQDRRKTTLLRHGNDYIKRSTAKRIYKAVFGKT